MSLVKEKAGFGQVKAMCIRFNNFLMEILSERKNKPFIVDSDAAQFVINSDIDFAIERISQFVDNKFRIGLMGVIDFDALPNWDCRGANMPYSPIVTTTPDYKTSVSGYQNFNRLKPYIKAIHKLKDGEESIAGGTLIYRLLADKEILINSNILDYFQENLMDDDVQEFLKLHQLKLGENDLYGNRLFAFGHIFTESKVLSQVRCFRQSCPRLNKNIWDADSYDYLSDEFFNKNYLVLVIDKEAYLKDKPFAL